MRTFQEWLNKTVENPEELKKKLQKLTNQLGLVTDPQGRSIGFNAHTAKQIMDQIKEIKEKLKTIEGK